MDDKKDAAQARAEKAFKRQEEGAQAMTEYEAEGLAVRAKTTRLRALRMGKEAKEKTSAPVKKKPQTNLTKSGKRLGRPPGKRAITKSARMAGDQLDRLADRSATDDERVSRKRRLLKGPKEFRDFRMDHPKRKD